MHLGAYPSAFFHSVLCDLFVLIESVKLRVLDRSGYMLHVVTQHLFDIVYSNQKKKQYMCRASRIRACQLSTVNVSTVIPRI